MNEYIADELIESTYLFCFKRVSDPEAAKDLSQDILCEALRVIAAESRFIILHRGIGKWHGINMQTSLHTNMMLHCPLNQQVVLWQIPVSRLNP